MHINCGGGGSDENKPGEQDYTDRGQLSCITFAWMVDLCSPYLEFNQGYLSKFNQFHTELVGTLKGKMKNCTRHKGGWAQGMINDSFDTGMAAAGSRTRAPRQYDELNKISAECFNLTNNTNEFIHPSARLRIKKRFENVGSEKVWERPTDQISLAGFQMKWNPEFRKDKHFSGLTWVKEDPATGKKITIPEWQINFSERLNSQLSRNELTPYLEHAVLAGDECLEMVKSPQRHLVPVLPEAPKQTAIGNVFNSTYLFFMGKLPSSYHSWENE